MVIWNQLFLRLTNICVFFEKEEHVTLARRLFSNCAGSEQLGLVTMNCVYTVTQAFFISLLDVFGHWGSGTVVAQ